MSIAAAANMFGNHIDFIFTWITFVNIFLARTGLHVDPSHASEPTRN